MKKIQGKDAFRNIRKRIVSYLSICLVIMLGLGGLFITRYMAAGINKAATNFYNDLNFKNFELISSLGITDEDIAQIKETEGVTDAEGVIRAGGSLTNGSINRDVTIISLTERISTPEIIEGNPPAAKDECMIGEDFAFLTGLRTGDRVRIKMDDIQSSEMASDEKFMEEYADEEAEAVKTAAEEEADNVLNSEEFTITGIMKHPDHVRRKSVDTVVLPKAAYNKEVTRGYYTHAFVKSEEPKGADIFKDDYFEKTADTRKNLEDLTETLAVDSTARAKQAAYDRIDKEWQETLATLGEAQDRIDLEETTLNEKLAQARKDLADAQKELDEKVGDYNKKIKDAEEKIRNGEKELRDGEKEIKDGEKELKDGEKKIRDGEKELKEYRDYLKMADEYLPEAEKYIADTRKIRETELKEAYNKLAYAQSILDALSKIKDKDSQEYKDKVVELAKVISDNQAVLLAGQEYFKKDDVMETTKKINDRTGIDAAGAVTKIRDFDLLALFLFAKEIQEDGGDYEKFAADTNAYITSVNDELKKLDEYQGYIDEYKANRDDLYKELDKKEKELEKGKKDLEKGKKDLEKAKEELAAGKKELAAAKEKLAAGKKELAAEKKKYEAQIRDGWNLYYSKKADYDSKLEEAKALLAENREAAEEKLAEARAEVEKIECKWLVFDRRANAGYVDIKSTLRAIGSASLVFGLLFMLISAIVCFSTLTIMIDEQKKMVGTVKAFGFHKSEILGKYLVFGVTAGIIGSLAGILVALGLSGIVLNAFNNTAMYHIGTVRSVITPGMTIIASLLMIGVCALATTIACTDILRSPASILMKGGTSKKKNNSNGKKTSSSRGGSLYSRLIIRNMLDDKVRVIISIIIIAFSTLLVGTGLSMKLGFDGMVKKQLSDVHHYDFKVDLGNKVTGADKAKLEAAMTNDGAEFLPASYESHIFHLEDRLDMLNVLTADPEKLDEFFAVRDLKKGTPLTIPDDGVLAQKKMKESYGFGEGSTITALNTDLHECNADVRGVFQNYVGRIAITSPTGYRTVFGEDPTYNCYYVKAAGGDSEKLQKELLAVSGDISFEESSAFASTFESVTFMYNLIVIVTTAIAILMSAMILSNLANIFLNRKKTELTVMRINGFSIKQTKGYLTRETVVTTAIGILLGVIAGVIAAPLIIRALEQPDLQFVRTFHLLAWVAAIAIEGLFSLVIYSIVFRKVKDLNFRDVA